MSTKTTLPSAFELVDLIHPVSQRKPLGHHDMLHAFARAAWTTIAEPGDAEAGWIIRQMGTTQALEALLSDVEGRDIAYRYAFKNSAQAIVDGFARWRARLDLDAVRQELIIAARHGIRLAVPYEFEWPRSLSALGVAAPIALWYRSRASNPADYADSVAIVGARAMTGYGEHVANELAAGMADRGITVISGGAYGIDGVAHRRALAAGGKTIAYLSNGVDHYYPAGHQELLARIAEEGCVVSELPPGAAPTKNRFLQRNRLIATATNATVVVEAGVRSGSFGIAANAIAMGRPLGAVPGPVTSAVSAGCHKLLREYGATPITNADELAELVRKTDGVSVSNAVQSERYARPDSDRADVSGGSGYSRYDYDESEENK